MPPGCSQPGQTQLYVTKALAHTKCIAVSLPQSISHFRLTYSPLLMSLSFLLETMYFPLFSGQRGLATIKCAGLATGSLFVAYLPQRFLPPRTNDLKSSSRHSLRAQASSQNLRGGFVSSFKTQMDSGTGPVRRGPEYQTGTQWTGLRRLLPAVADARSIAGTARTSYEPVAKPPRSQVPAACLECRKKKVKVTL